MNTMKLIPMLLLAGLCAGCGAVYSVQPVGSAPLPIQAGEWEGVWANRDGFLVLKASNPDQGILRLVWIDEDLELESYDVRLLKAGEWIFGNVRDDENKDRFLWARVAKDGDRILLWTPSVAKIRAAVREGALPGTIDKDGDVTLGELSPEHVSLIASERRGVLFDWEEPVTLFKR